MRPLGMTCSTRASKSDCSFSGCRLSMDLSSSYEKWCLLQLASGENTAREWKKRLASRCPAISELVSLRNRAWSAGGGGRGLEFLSLAMIFSRSCSFTLSTSQLSLPKLFSNYCLYRYSSYIFELLYQRQIKLIRREQKGRGVCVKSDKIRWFSSLNLSIYFIGMIPARGADSLDEASERYSRAKSGYSNTSDAASPYRHDLMLKNLYRQQLDDIMKQKNEQKRAQKERQHQEREQYNQRVNQGRQAERLKDLSYKNYYQMLSTNQNSIVRNFPELHQEREGAKEKLIQRGIEEEKQRSQQWWETEQRRLENARKAYKNDLDGQLNEKNSRNAQESESRVRQQQEFKKITFTPQEIAQYQRERRLLEQNKYKQDLDKLSPGNSSKAQVIAGNAIVGGGYTSNDFNTHQEVRHDPMVNPMPYNIQNPYILRQFMRKQQAQQNIFSNQQRP